jgi:hypothetical protein
MRSMMFLPIEKDDICYDLSVCKSNQSSIIELGLKQKRRCKVYPHAFLYPFLPLK